MTDFNSHQFSKVYDDLGISIPKLGCIMLDLPSLPVLDLLGEEGKDDLYVSEHKDRFWINGAVAEKNAHVTLLYGLLETGVKWKRHVNTVLDGWTPPSVEIESVSFFPSPYPDENYACIIGHIKMTEELLEGHERLSLLPHIDTNPGYKPHVTLAYVNQAALNKTVLALRPLRGVQMDVQSINYGKNHD